MASPRVKGSIANGTSSDRCPNDFYATPRSFVRALLDREQFAPLIWEPAAGDGAISAVLRERHYTVVETDLNPRGQGITQADFLAASPVAGADIITNPPFSLLCEFLTHAYRCTHQKFAVVMPISGLNSSRRYEAAWSHLPVSSIYLAGRYQKVRSDRGLISSQFTHIWVVVDKAHSGPPKFEWLPNVIYSGEGD